MFLPSIALRRFQTSHRHFSRSPSLSNTISNTAHHRWTPPSNGRTTGIHVHNCVTRRKVPIVLRHQNWATWYACGPTVYDAAHIGHASCYVKQDILQRILRQHFHINLLTAMNITDVDDKIIARSAAANVPWTTLVRTCEASFWQDLDRLGCARPNHVLRVSEHIPQIVRFIETLINDGFAYCHEDGSVYFDVSKYPAYGKLQTLNLEPVEHSDKHNSTDFALWKGRTTPDKGEPHWATPWSTVGGRPGWHIECSAMATHLFGTNIDFHSGGLDLRFPHHENEEAQSCAHHNCDQWVNYWIHTGQLHVVGDDSKMSKSLNNTVGIAEMLESYSAPEFRMACLLSNYHNRMDFSPSLMHVSRSVLQRLHNFSEDARHYVRGVRPIQPFQADDVHIKLSETANKIDEALKDNFNTAKTIEALLDLITFANKSFNSTDQSTVKSSATPDLGAVLAVDSFISNYTSTVGLDAPHSANDFVNESQIGQLVDGMLDIRSDIRQRAAADKNADLFKLCDSIRDRLNASGIRVKDVGNRSTWSFGVALK